VAIVLGGCASVTPPQQFVQVRAVDGPFWVDPDDVKRYRCNVGLFVCQSEGGRRSKRLCQCVEEL
jgi:hypothetical protein